MITIVCRWDTVQMDNEMEWRMWRQLQGAFFPVPSNVDFVFVPINESMGKVDFQQFDTMDEALSYAEIVNPLASKVFLEPSGVKTLAAIPAGDLILVLGNTGTGNADKASAGEIYKINSPAKVIALLNDENFFENYLNQNPDPNRISKKNKCLIVQFMRTCSEQHHVMMKRPLVRCLQHSLFKQRTKSL